MIHNICFDGTLKCIEKRNNFDLERLCKYDLSPKISSLFDVIVNLIDAVEEREIRKGIFKE